MQNISLGDYKGGRDTLQGALTGQYTPLNETMNAAAAYGVNALGSIGKRMLEEQTSAHTLHNALEQKSYEDQLAQDAIQRKIGMEGEAAGGEEDAMIAHAEHMFSLLSPEDQAKNAGWLAGMKRNRGRGTPLERIGRNKWNSEHGTDEATSLIKAQAAAAKKVPTDAVPLVTPATGAKKTPSTKHKINVI